MKVKNESEVAQSCLTLYDPMDCSRPGSSIHGIFQARVLQWGAIAFSECSVQPCVKVVFIEWRRVGMHFSVTARGGSQFLVSPLELFPAPWTHGSPAVVCVRITWGIG